MTRPDSVNGPSGSPTQQWGWPAPYAGQQFPGQAQAPQQTQQPYPQSYQQTYQQSYEQPYQQVLPVLPAAAGVLELVGAAEPAVPLGADGSGCFAARYQAAPSASSLRWLWPGS